METKRPIRSNINFTGEGLTLNENGEVVRKSGRMSVTQTYIDKDGTLNVDLQYTRDSE